MESELTETRMHEIVLPAVADTPVAEVGSSVGLPGSGPRLGERVRSLRVAAGLTQTQLAGERFSKEYISQIERGKTRPTESTVAWLAERLGVDPAFIASGFAAGDLSLIHISEPTRH